MGTRSLEESPSWKWEGAEGKWKGWLHSSQFWHRLLEKEEVADDLSNKWPEGSLTTSIWRDRVHAHFRNRLQNTPLRASLDLACVEIEGSFHSKSSNTRWQKGLKMLEQINQLIDIADRASLRLAVGNSNEDESNQSNKQTVAIASRSPQHHGKNPRTRTRSLSHCAQWKEPRTKTRPIT
ncbi:hypothetical protein R1flu_023937 [Riccia fluitans]|uniref:Uncharacterized protein n=1 Tax=Riccia fluitans TaxID=41844 RepID=A0ABD1XTF6_9MARC